MFLVGIFQWWYGSGWLRHIKRSYVGVLRTIDFFSITLLLKTLFNPFKQISASDTGNNLPAQFQAFLDRSFSRMVGATIRTLTIAIAVAVIGLRLLWVLCSIVIWSILPFLPILGAVMWLGGVMPWK